MSPILIWIRRRWRRIIADFRLFYHDRVVRKSNKGFRRVLGLLLTLAIACIVCMDWPQLEEQQNINIDALASTALREALSSRSGQTSIRDPRVWNGWNGINTIFAFGDSYTDTSFNVNGPQPDKDNPLGNPAWPGRTASYGPNYLGHLVSTFRDHFIGAYNFANQDSPFEATLTSTDALHLQAALSFRQQIEIKFIRKYGTSTKLWSKSKRGRGEWSQMDSLFLVYTGSDDILRKFMERGGGTNETAARQNIEVLELGLEKLYNAGARNFLLLNYPSLEASPAARLSSIPNSFFDLGADIVHHNARLAFLAHRFGTHHPKTNVFLFDQHKLSLAVRRDPSAFPETMMLERLEGFCLPYTEERPAGMRAGENTKDVFHESCAVAMEKWFWRDEKHHTEPYEHLLARSIVELLNDKMQRLPLEFY